MKKVLYFDMDGVLVDFESGLKQCQQSTLIHYEGRFDEIPNIFGKMKPIKGAIEAFEKLSTKYDCYILSTAPWNNWTAWADKLIWVKSYLGDKAEKRLILSHNKHLNIGDYLIDDRLKNGADRFKGCHIHFGTEKFPDWEHIVDFLMENYK